MKSINSIWLVCILFLVSSNCMATLYDFDGVLTVYDDVNASIGPSDATGQIDFDLGSGIGSGGTIQEFLPKTGGATFSDIQIAGLGGNLFAVDFTVDLLSSTFSGSLVWEIVVLAGDDLMVTTVDGNSDGIPGLPLPDTSPFPGFSIALDGVLSPVPVPAAGWLLGTGLLVLLGFGRRNSA